MLGYPHLSEWASSSALLQTEGESQPQNTRELGRRFQAERFESIRIKYDGMGKAISKRLSRALEPGGRSIVVAQASEGMSKATSIRGKHDCRRYTSSDNSAANDIITIYGVTVIL